MMKRSFILTALAVALACPCVATTIHATELNRSLATEARIVDVVLGEGGTLRGQLISPLGTHQPGMEARLIQAGRLVAVARNTEDGQFQFTGVRPGVYQLETPYGNGVYRLWAPETAPPSAREGILLIQDGQVVRGNIDLDRYGPAIRGGIAGALLGAGLYWALDHNSPGS